MPLDGISWKIQVQSWLVRRWHLIFNPLSSFIKNIIGRNLYLRTSKTSRRIKRLAVSSTNINTGRTLLRRLEIKFTIFFKRYWDLITKETVCTSLLSASQFSASRLYTRRLRCLRRLRRLLSASKHSRRLIRLTFNTSTLFPVFILVV